MLSGIAIAGGGSVAGGVGLVPMNDLISGIFGHRLPLADSANPMTRLKSITPPTSSAVDFIKLRRENPFRAGSVGFTVIGCNLFSRAAFRKQLVLEWNGSDLRFYPKPIGQNPDLFQRYWTAAKAERDVTFLGRLATYKYLDMEDVVAQVMAKLGKSGVEVTWR